MNISIFDIIVVVFLVVLFSRQIYNLSLSLLITSSTIMVTIIALSISAVLLSIAAIPTLVIGCKIAERHYATTETPRGVVSICGHTNKTPRVVHSRSVELYTPRPAPTSRAGNY